MLGVLAGRYRILKPLGGGGFAQTFLAADEHLPGHPTCVVKQLKLTVRDPATFKTAKRLFDQEARVLYRLGNHEQIPRLLAHFDQGGEFFLVQEFVDGQPLNQEWAGHPQLSELEGVKLVRDVLQVLAFVHQQGVIHRDIKPSNLIRRTRDRTIVLIDFGAVKQVTSQLLETDAQENYTIAIGSPGYMPIEQQLHQPHFSSDIYAVGMVALQALTGIAPIAFPREPQTQEIDFVQLGDRLNLRLEFAAILQNMVRQDYRQRYQNAVEALQVLEPLVTELDLEPLPQSNSAAAVNSVERSVLDRHFATSPDLSPTLPPQFDPTHLQLGTQPSEIPASDHPAAQTEMHPSSRELRNRQALLNKVKHYWIKGVLETSLHDQVLIVLGMEEQSQAVASPWNLAVQTHEQRVKTLPEGTHIISIFAGLGAGRTLLILGEPGSGKTTTLLQLTRDLLQRAEQDETHLIPVVLNLSSWAGENQPISNWIVEELNTKYQVPKKIGQPWVENQQLLLLLDGLDEVRSEHRNACVLALNHFQQEYTAEMVVCSRIKDYEALSTRLNFQSAIYLRSLTQEQIHHYLDSLSIDLTGLRTLLEQDTALQELAQSPLLLNIMVLAYQGATAGNLPIMNTIEDCRKQLFDRYIGRMFKRRNTSEQYSESSSLKWLHWLANGTIQQSQSIFLIEQIQPDLLTSLLQRWMFLTISGLNWGLIYGVMFGTAVGINTGLGQGARIGLFVGLLICGIISLLHGVTFLVEIGLFNLPVTSPRRWIYSLFDSSISAAFTGLLVGINKNWSVGLIVALFSGTVMLFIDRVMGGIWRTGFHTVKPVESLKWSWSNVRNPLIFWISLSSIIGLLLESLDAVNHGLAIGSFYGLIFGLVIGLSNSSEIETKTVPNQGIWQSARNALFTTIISTASFLGLAALLKFSSFFAIILGVLLGLLAGGVPCIEHFSLRLVLYLTQCIPWNYAHFLNYAVDRILLQKVGGGYIFIHRLLMEHFAAMQLAKNSPEFATLSDHRH